MQILPSASLAPFIKNYTIVTIEKDLDKEVFYPSGYVDLIVNISGGLQLLLSTENKKILLQ